MLAVEFSNFTSIIRRQRFNIEVQRIFLTLRKRINMFQLSYGQMCAISEIFRNFAMPLVYLTKICFMGLTANAS